MEIDKTKAILPTEPTSVVISPDGIQIKEKNSSFASLPLRVVVLSEKKTDTLRKGMLHPDEYFKDKTRLSIKKGG